MTRLEFLGMRLLPTACSLAVVALLVRLAWYPGEYFGLAGTAGLVWVMIGVNLALGPGLTAIVFRPAKRGLKFDIALIAAVEVLALGLMAQALFAGRPAFTVFAVDRFEVVTWDEVGDPVLAETRVGRRTGLEPKLAFADLPSDPEVFDRLLDETVFLGLPDIDRRPEFWQPYPAGIAAVRAKARPLTAILNGDGEGSRAVQDWLRRAGGEARDYSYVPVRGRRADAAMVLHADIGFPVVILPVDPW